MHKIHKIHKIHKEGQTKREAEKEERKERQEMEKKWSMFHASHSVPHTLDPLIGPHDHSPVSVRHHILSHHLRYLVLQLSFPLRTSKWAPPTSGCSCRLSDFGDPALSLPTKRTMHMVGISFSSLLVIPIQLPFYRKWVQAKSLNKFKNNGPAINYLQKKCYGTY